MSVRNIIRRYVTNIDPIVPPEVHTNLPKIDIYKYRKWKYFKPYQETLSYKFKKSSFTVSSYNILSQHYLWPTVYKYIPPQYLNLEYRLGLLNAIYRQLDSDIMCFQEMEYDLYQKIWSDKTKYGVFHNYNSVFIKKPKPNYWGEKSEDKMDGCSIFVKESQFKILAQDCFEIRDRNFLPANEMISQRLLSRNTVACILLLEHKATGQKIVLSNTHLYWNPNFDDVKYLQTLILTRELQKIAQKIDTKSVIMCGDFNSNSKSLVYNYLSNSLESSFTKKLDKIVQDYNLSEQEIRQNFMPMTSAYPQDKYTVYTPHYKDAIDYIWYNSNQQTSNIDLIKILDGISIEYLSNEIGFPNDKYPSDHIPIVSEFAFR